MENDAWYLMLASRYLEKEIEQKMYRYMIGDDMSWQKKKKKEMTIL